MDKIKFNLKDTLDEIGITRNALAVESKVRPMTVADLVNGESKSINLSTLVMLLDGLNRLAKENEIDKQYDINDIVQYKGD